MLYISLIGSSLKCENSLGLGGTAPSRGLCAKAILNSGVPCALRVRRIISEPTGTDDDWWRRHNVVWTDGKLTHKSTVSERR